MSRPVAAYNSPITIDYHKPLSECERQNQNIATGHQAWKIQTTTETARCDSWRYISHVFTYLHVCL